VTWTFLFLMVALKIPIIGLLSIVWWAIKQTPEPAGDGDGGTPKPRTPSPHDPSDRHRRSPRPPRPRRGPHGDSALPAPPRVRSVTARGRELTER
jgi:hypothetical protein